MDIEELDRKIGMPDIEQEWQAFERNVMSDDRPRLALSRHLSRAAAVVAVCLLGAVAVASSLYIYNNVEGAEAEPDATPAATVSDDVQTPPTVTETTAGTKAANFEQNDNEFVFDNVEMQDIAACLQQHYGVEPVFVNDKVRHIRLYLTLSKTRTIDEVVALLNNLQVVHLNVDGGRLIIE